MPYENAMVWRAGGYKEMVDLGATELSDLDYWFIIANFRENYD
jgi:hypothetical protein